MNATFVATDGVVAEISAACEAPVEIAGVILARAVSLPSQVRLLAREVHWVPQEAYAHQSRHALTIRPEGYIHALARAESTGSVPIWFHTHPGVDSDPRPSPHDDIVDQQLADLFRLRSGSPYYGALIAASRPAGFAFTGFIDDSTSRWSIDSRVAETRLSVSPAPRDLPMIGAGIFSGGYW